MTVCACVCHSNGAYPPPCPEPGGCGPHEEAPPSCVAPGCRRHATAGWQLCRGHAANLGQWLADVEQLYATLDPALTLSTNGNSNGHAGLASERAPARLQVLVLRDARTTMGAPADTAQRDRHVHAEGCDGRCRGRCRSKGIGPWCLFCEHDTCTAWRAGRQRDHHDDEADAGSHRLLSIVGVLGGWAGLIRQERKLAPAVEPVTVSSERQLLVAHLDWAMAQPWCDELFREVRQVWGLLKAAHGERAPKPQARCWVPRGDGGLCGGPIWADPGAAWCGTCRASWTGLDLLRISMVLDGAA